VIHLVGEGAALQRPLILGLQILLGGAAGYGGYRYADLGYQGLRDQGLGTPRITAVMPRFVGAVEGAKDPNAAYLQAVFFLTAPAPPETWEFASAEFERISGIREATLRDDRIEVVFQNGVVKEKHVLELLTMCGFQLALDREMDLDAP